MGVMKSKVFFAAVRNGEAPESVARKALKLAEQAGLNEMVQPDGLTAILQHVGEGKNVGHVKPEVTAAIAGRIAEKGGKPFFTGTSTLYTGRRHNAVDHLMQAYDHGFTPERIGCPIVMSDGLRGADQRHVKLSKTKHFKTAYLGSAVGVMDGLVAISHPTGHPAVGFAAAAKNVAMGLASRGGKMAMHHGDYPVFVAKKCTACGRCARWCPEEAIVIEKTAKLVKAKCVGCGECLAVCPSDAIDFEWKLNGLGIQERVMEYCAAVRSELGEKILYINVIQEFTEGCDCFGTVQKPVCPDVGVVVSRDLVAVDSATADLINQATGKDTVRTAAGREYRVMFEYAEKLGLGSREYELVE